MAQIANKAEFRAQFEFADTTFRTGAWLALKAVYGPYKGWDKMARLDARNFLAAVKDFTPETLSLGSLKSALLRFNSEPRLHRVAFFFLSQVKDSYCAEDAAEFHELIAPLEESGKSYRILFNKDVHSFRDVAFNRYYKDRNFHIVRTRSAVMKSIYRRLLMNTRWAYAGKPTQERFDGIFALIDEAADHPLKSPSELSVSLFFNIMDILNRRFANGMITADERRIAISDIFQVYRYCIRYEGNILPDLPLIDLRILFSGESVKFFVSEYVSREHTFVFNRRGKSRIGRLVSVDIDNPVVRSSYGYLLRSGRVAQEEFCACKDTLAKSLGEHVNTIGRSEQWDESILMGQVNYYREYYKDKKQRTCAMSFVKALYISIDEQTNGDFFRNTQTVTYGLLITHRFVRYCDEGFEFRVWSQYDDVADGKKMVFIVRDFNRLMKKYLKEDYIAVDFSMIHNPFYRSLAWKSITSKPGRLYRVSFAYTLRHLLPMLALLKHQKGWITPEFQEFSLYDAIATRAFFENKSDSDLTYNNYMMNVRDFLRWANASGEIAVDEVVYEMLTNKKLSTGPTNTPVLTDEDFTTLSAWFFEKSKDDPLYSQAFILMNICAVTPIRIGHACSLLHRELVFDDKLNSYIVLSTSKGTRGNIGEIVLGEKANLFIKKAIVVSEKTGLDCTQEDLREQLFLYCEKGKYAVWTPKKFGKFLKDACEACNLPAYNSKNIRATYMTRAYIEACESGVVNDWLLKLHSYHRNNGTTIEHYVNHDEALAALTDSLKRGNDWQKTIYPDERKALQDTLEDYQTILDNIDDVEQKSIITNEMKAIQDRLNALN